MLLVDDDEAEVRERDVRAEQAMGPDDDVDLFRRQLGDDVALFLRRLKAAERGDANGKVGKPIAECSLMLIRENRRGYEHGDLSIGLHGLERGANGDLGLSVSDIADQQP